MANLLHRLLRGRRAVPEAEAKAATLTTAPVPEEPEASAAPASDETDDARRHDPSRFEAKPQPGRGRRKTSDEISTIGPGTP